MHRIQLAAAAITLCCPCAFADPVFFDDFDGNKLQPWWGFFSECGAMEYTVEDSLFKVTRIYKVQPCELTAVLMGAEFEEQLDFDMTAIMGWDEGSAQAMGMWAPRTGGQVLGAIGYRVSPGQAPVIVAEVVGDTHKSIEIPAPPPGLYEFRLTRTGKWTRAYFEGQLLVEVQANNYVFPLLGTEFVFDGPDSDEFSTLYVDRITVTPAPGTLAVLLAGAYGASRRTRRSV